MVPALGVGNEAEDAVPLALGKKVEDVDAAHLARLQPDQRLPGLVDVHAPLVKSCYADEVGAGVHQGGKLFALLLELPAVGDIPKVHRQT